MCRLLLCLRQEVLPLLLELRQTRLVVCQEALELLLTMLYLGALALPVLLVAYDVLHVALALDHLLADQLGGVLQHLARQPLLTCYL